MKNNKKGCFKDSSPTDCAYVLQMISTQISLLRSSTLRKLVNKGKIKKTNSNSLSGTSKPYSHVFQQRFLRYHFPGQS